MLTKVPITLIFSWLTYNIGTETNKNVGQTKETARKYLEKHTQRNEHEILMSEFSIEDVIDVCKNLNPETSVDPHGFKQNIVIQSGVAK